MIASRAALADPVEAAFGSYGGYHVCWPFLGVSSKLTTPETSTASTVAGALANDWTAVLIMFPPRTTAVATNIVRGHLLRSSSTAFPG